MPLGIYRLEAPHRFLLEQFDCGDHALNHYLKRFAWTNQARLSVGVTYVAVDEEVSKTVLAYHTLASSSISRSLFPDDTGRAPSPYASVPVILLGRLAVDRRVQGRGIGKLLLRHAFDVVLKVRRQIGCRCLIVDAYPSATQWYDQFGFAPVAGAPAGAPTQKMYIDLLTVEAAGRQA